MPATDASGYIDHPLLTSSFIERRRYQLELAGTAQNAHTLVCLPTGLGKTTVSLLVTATRIQSTGGKAVLLAPTKPLVQQHAEFYRNALSIPDENIIVFTGEVRPDDRKDIWDDAQVVIATPQVIENDLIGNRISLSTVTHLTFDECHRATGDYAYVYIAERYHSDASAPLVTAMSASPGGDKESILTVCNNLGVSTVSVMTEDDADVSDYTYNTEVEWERIELPDEILKIRDALNDVITDRLQDLKSIGVANTTQPDLSQSQLNQIRSKLQRLIDADNSDGYQGMSIHAEVMKLRRAVELIETQSVESARQYFERQRNAARSSGASKASQRLIAEPKVRESIRLVRAFDEIHPKFSRARILLAQTLGIEGGDRVIVFTESRDTAEALTQFLGKSFEVHKFVGQGDKEGSEGMTQHEQQETLDAFRDGEYEVLISTSVAEEGLDIPEVDLVLFFEPVPTAIRSIQRKGRTGRQTEGRVVVLLAEDTRDEAFFWISRRREQEMEDELQALKDVAGEIESELDPSQPELTSFTMETNSSEQSSQADPVGQAGLPEFDPSSTSKQPPSEAGSITPGTSADDSAEIVIDQRELNASVAKTLSKQSEITTRLETLAVADYVLSDRVAVERKSVSDFLDTLLGAERSLFEQVGELTRAYARPLVIIEGEGLYEERDVHPEAIRGALSSLIVDFGISILEARDEADTAALLQTIAVREQTKRDRTVSTHGEKSKKTLSEQQEYVVSAIGDVGPVTATALLEQFESVEAVMTASEEELQTVDGVGTVTAGRIREVVGSRYT
ncbi:MAG: ERCC4-like helicase [Haloquadratum sp. J07HQX50]|nr:MAG: ERCC4-like helicase [Haloquadratum sp. J07HQX50]